MKNQNITAVYPGSFDPVTYGHLDIMRRAKQLFPRIIVAVAKNAAKTATFSAPERAGLLKEALRETKMASSGITVDLFDGLLIDYLKKIQARVVIRGLRFISDFEYEFQMVLMNRKLLPAMETIYLMPDERYSYLSSSIVKEIARYGQDVKKFAPACVAKALASRLRPPS